MWPGDLLEIWCHEGDSVGTKLCSSISGGWRLFQPFFLGKLVMGSSNGGIPIKIFKFWDAPNFGLFNEFKNTPHKHVSEIKIWCWMEDDIYLAGPIGPSPPSPSLANSSFSVFVRILHHGMLLAIWASSYPCHISHPCCSISGSGYNANITGKDEDDI